MDSRRRMGLGERGRGGWAAARYKIWTTLIFGLKQKSGQFLKKFVCGEFFSKIHISYF